MPAQESIKEQQKVDNKDKFIVNLLLPWICFEETIYFDHHCLHGNPAVPSATLS